MNREIKFRIWSFLDKAFHHFELQDYPSGIAGGVSEPQQFTGLKDKNGKEIYEGDILHFEFGGENWIGQVAWKYPLGIELVNGGGWVSLSHAEKFSKVIGNIHENKELIK